MLSISLVMVYSASIAYAEADAATNNRYFYLFRHMIFMTIGLAGAAITFQVPTSIWQKYAGKFFLFAGFLLVLVLIPGIGKVVNGSRRWINLVVLNLQPSEVMKLAAVIYAADYTVRKAAKLHSVREGFLPILAAIVAVALLLLLEPDFGALMVVMSITMGIVFLGGINLRIFAGLAVMAVFAVVLLIITSPYRLKRVLGFLDPWDDPYGKGYQLSHSLIAIGRGEWFGVGLGGSVEKTVLPAGGAYRLHHGRDFGRVRFCGYLCGAGPVRLDCAPRLPYRYRIQAAGALLPVAGGAGHRHLAGGANLLQRGREHGFAAYQGPDAAADVVWRLGHAVQPGVAGGAIACGL